MSTSSEEDILVHLPFSSWYRSTDSIVIEKNRRPTQSESMLTFSNCTSDLLFSQMGFKNAEPQITFLPVLPTRNEKKQELEVLRINMSTDIDNVVALRQSQVVALRKKSKRRRSKRKKSDRSKELSEITELLTEIERSDSVKTDKVIWKFLRRSSSFRKEALDNRILTLKSFQFPGTRPIISSIHNEFLLCDPPFRNIKHTHLTKADDPFPGVRNFRFQNAQPVKITCPNCNFFITTNVKHMSSVRSNLNSVVQSIVGLCISSDTDQSFKDSVHSCPLCEIYLGYCPAFNVTFRRDSCSRPESGILLDNKMVSASSTSAKNLFVESKLRLSDRVQVNVNNIAAVTRQIQRGSKSSENLLTAAKNFALQEAAIENSETNLKKLKLLTTHLNNQLDSLHSSASKMDMVLEQVCSMQR